MNNISNAIEIKNITKNYADFTLDNVSLTLPTGCIMGLVGENGAGKSTLIRLIMNAIKADSGSVCVLSTDNTSPEFLQTKQDIGIVLDEAFFPAMMNATDIEKIMQSTYKNWDGKLFFDYLARFDIPKDKAFSKFSRGMKMKHAIAVAISHHPKLLILDEATSGLDPMVRDEILDIFNEFTKDETHSILISSHIVSDLEKICDYVAFIHKGKLVFSEEKDRLIDEYAIIKTTAENADAVPGEAVIGRKTGKYGVELLVKKRLVSGGFNPEKTSLEDIILFMARGEKRV